MAAGRKQIQLSKDALLLADERHAVKEFNLDDLHGAPLAQEGLEAETQPRP
jgi:hypothetical protein